MALIRPTVVVIAVVIEVEILLVTNDGIEVPNLKSVRTVLFIDGFEISATSFSASLPSDEVSTGLTPNVNPEFCLGIFDTAVPKTKPVVGAVAVSVFFSTFSFLRSSSSFGAVDVTPPNPKLNFAAAVEPKENLGTSSLTVCEPGFACSQQTHLSIEVSLRVIQASHSHLEAF